MRQPLSHSHRSHRFHRFHRSRCNLVFVITLALSSFLIGCGGGLSPKDAERYETLNAQLGETSAKQRVLEAQIKRDFQESARLERSRSLKGERSFSCGYQLSGQALGPLPFKKRKGKSAQLKKRGSAPLSGCQSYTVRIR